MGCRADVYVSEKKKVSLPTLGMESQFLAHLKTVFSGYCFSAEFVHWQKWLHMAHCMKSSMDMTYVSLHLLEYLAKCHSSYMPFVL